MERNHSRSPVFRRTAAVLISLSLFGCEVGSQTAPKSPYRAPVAGNSGVSPSATSSEVNTPLTVTVIVKDKGGNGIGSVVPTITAVNTSTGSSSGVTSGGCGRTDGKGSTTCTIRANLPGTYTIQTVTPVALSTSTTVTFYQVPRSLSFTQAPSSTATSETAFTQQPKVTVLDAAGNAVPGGKTAGTAGTGVVTLSLTTAGGATLTPGGSTTATANASTGVATFAGLKIDKAGTYTLTASLTDTVSGVVTGTSTSIVVSAGTGVKMKFRTSPPSSTTTSVATDTIFPQQPVVVMTDNYGNEVLTDNSCVVNLTMTGGETGDQLLGTNLSKRMSSGVADFAGLNLRISRVGTTNTPLTNYQLQATGSGTCSGITSGAPYLSTQFTVTLAGKPYQLSVVQAPGTSALNMTWSLQPIIQVLDVEGNLVANDNTTSVVMDILSTTATTQGTLVGSTSIQVQNGYATFSGLSMPATTAQSGFAGTYTYRFRGFNSPLTIAQTTATQVITANGLIPTALRFLVQPQNVALNQPMSDVQVITVDSNGFFCAFDNSTVVTLAAGTGAGFSLSFPTLTVQNGIANFTGLKYTAIGAKTVTASAVAAGMSTITSSTFAISSFSSTAEKLAFTTTPVSSAVTGSPWTTQPVVAVKDAYGNTITSNNSTIVTLDCVLPITCPGKLIGNTQLRVTNGVANFSGAGLHIGSTTTGVELKATASPVMPISPTYSDQFNEN